FTTASVPILVAAPGRLSMINGRPNRSDSHWLIRRATMSAGPPGGAPTIKCTGRCENGATADRRQAVAARQDYYQVAMDREEGVGLQKEASAWLVPLRRNGCFEL